ncbi:MAG: hypothetical protein ACYDAQ_12365, partial [Mycobacteriales bacterium]
PMVWQAVTRFRWSLYDAYLASPREVRQLPGTALRLLCLLGNQTGGISLPCPPQLRTQLVAMGVTVLALGPSPWQVAYLRELTGLLGPPRVAGGLAIWRLAPPTRVGQ